MLTEMETLKALGSLFLYVLAFASTGVAWLMWQIGSRNHWSSDGPAMLFIMLILAASVAVAFACWSSIVGSFFSGE